MTFCFLTIKTHELVSAWKHVIWDNLVLYYRIILFYCYEGRDTVTNSYKKKALAYYTFREMTSWPSQQETQRYSIGAVAENFTS